MIQKSGLRHRVLIEASKAEFLDWFILMCGGKVVHLSVKAPVRPVELLLRNNTAIFKIGHGIQNAA